MIPLSALHNLTRFILSLSSFFLLLFLAACANNDSGGGTIGKSGSGISVTVSGRVWYEDRIFDHTGFTGKALRPVRDAVLEVVRESDLEVLVVGSTTGEGTYELTFSNSGVAGVYISVLAADADNRVSVENGSGAVYAIRSTTIDDSTDGPFVADLTATMEDAGGVFNILDVFLEGASFTQTLAGDFPPPVTAIWSPGSCDGTYFDPLGHSIRILGGCEADSDEYDDTVLLHEYAHFLTDQYSRDDSPGGIHFLDDNSQDIRLSWSEGWGNFFPAAVRGDPLYVDTVGNVAGIAFEIEELTSPMTELSLLGELAVYTTNEVSVAAMLWDIFDESPQEAPGGEEDGVSVGMEPIWDVFLNYLPCETCNISNVSFEDFWDGWMNRGHGFLSEMEGLASSRKMALMSDGFEPDDLESESILISVDGDAQSHTFYADGDVDYLWLDVAAGKTYSIETLGLSNGADTHIELFDSNGFLVDQNDNADGITYNPFCGVNSFFLISTCPANDETTLSSRIVLTSFSDGTYSVRVSRSVDAPPSAGRYGGYQIRVTSE